MEKYNKVYFALWVLLSALTLALLTVLILNSMAPLFELDEDLVGEGIALSFLLLLFMSEIIGAGLATFVINRIPIGREQMRGRLMSPRRS